MLSVVRYMQHVAVSGVYTELREGSSSKAMRAQLSEFDRVLDRLRKEGVETGVVHAVHSSALFRAADLPLYNVVRVDAALSGRLPGRTGLVRVGVVETRIAEERWIPVGQAVDGGRKAKSAIRAGVVPLGLGDGFGIEASLSGREGLRRFIFGSASAPSIRLQNGEKLKRLGRLGADWLLVDLTHSEAGVGAPVLIDVDPMYARGLTKTVV